MDSGCESTANKSNATTLKAKQFLRPLQEKSTVIESSRAYSWRSSHSTGFEYRPHPDTSARLLPPSCAQSILTPRGGTLLLPHPDLPGPRLAFEWRNRVCHPSIFTPQSRSSGKTLPTRRSYAKLTGTMTRSVSIESPWLWPGIGLVLRAYLINSSHVFRIAFISKSIDLLWCWACILDRRS